MKDSTQSANKSAGMEQTSSRIPRFYRLSVEQRLAFLQRNFNLTNEQVAALREGKALRIRHAVNMVENAIGVFSVPLGLGLNFLVNGRDYLVPMAIEEASIIAAVSKSALMIRQGGGFETEVDDPVMIGQVQVLDLKDPEAAAGAVLAGKQEIIDEANRHNQRMVERGGGVFDVETRIIDGGEGVGRMLIVHLLMDVREAMGANAVNYSCEAAGPVVERLTGGRVNLRILSNLADRRLARARFAIPVAKLSTEGVDGAEVAQRMVEAGRFAWADPYRATTHNKGIFNGIGAAAVALGQDWRAIEAGGHAYAARDGQYRSLTTFEVRDGHLVGGIELPMQAGWFGGAVNSHPGVKLLRRISGVENARELAGMLAAVGLAQNFGACLALSTVGIQKGHMALHARSVAISVGVPATDVEQVAQEMIKRGEVKVAIAEQIYRKICQGRENEEKKNGLPVSAFAPGKIVLFGEHAVVYGYPGITAAIDLGLTVKVKQVTNGSSRPRFTYPQIKHGFEMSQLDGDDRRFSQALDKAYTMRGLEQVPIELHVESDLVPGMGLGSSAAFSTALVLALREYCGLCAQRRYDPELFDEVQELESIFHGTPSGMDAATVLSGGVVWFRNGPPREVLPIRLPVPLTGVIIMVEPGARTIELVTRVRQQRELRPAQTDGILSEIGNLTAQAGMALGSGDMESVGELMYENHELLTRLGVSTPGLDAAVELLKEHGVLGAKLTGAGGGGAVIALTHPEQRYQLIEELKDRFPMIMPFDMGKVD